MSRIRAFQPLAIASLIFGALIAQTAFAAARVGQPAPAFSAVDADGKTRQLSEFAGKTVVLEWTNDGCPFVQKHYGSGNMQALQRQARSEGVVWLSVISSAPGQQGFADAARARQLSEQRSAHPSAVLLDPAGELGHLYGALTTPHMFIIDAKGTLVYSGAIDSIASADPGDIAKADNYVRDALAQVAAGKPVATPSSRPYGCSVKYAS
jgi:peroxiredoxin